MKIYVASSWRNGRQPSVVRLLRDLGHEVYDFRNPVVDDPKTGARGVGTGFQWSKIDEKWLTWTPHRFVDALDHPLARVGFEADRVACEGADATVLVLPCGRSAHLELGVAVGRKQPTAILMLEPSEPELMYRWCDVLTSLDALKVWASNLPKPVSSAGFFGSDGP